MPTLDLAAILNVPHLSTYLDVVDQRLATSLASDNKLLSVSCERLVKAGGKRLRPALLIAVAASQGQKIDNKVISAATAVELVHLASLVHDDVIDNSETRWSSSTLNRQAGSGQAIVVGDYLLAQAGMMATAISPQAAGLIFRAMAALCDGQLLELNDLYNLKRSPDSLLKAINGKSAALIAVACQLGGLCAGLSPKRCALLGQYGNNLGISFQLVDDLLDLLSSNTLLGKPAGVDARQGVYTMPLLLGLGGSRSAALKADLKDPVVPAANLTKILLADGSIRRTVELVEDYNQAAVLALSSFGETNNLAALVTMPQRYTKWALSNLIIDKYRQELVGYVS